MRVLVVSTPGAGHITPLVPLIDALVDRATTCMSGPEARVVVEKTGGRFEQAGVSQAEVLARLATRTRGGPGDGIPPERIIHYSLPRAFGEIAVDEMIDDVLEVPAVAHLFGPIPPWNAVVLANDAVSPIWRVHGRSVPGWAGMFRDMTIQICPPSLEPAEVPVGETMQLRPTVLPTASSSTAERPLVYMTFGTLFNANLDLLRLVLDALADEPIDVVATVGRDQDPTALLPYSSNVRVERFILQAELLPRCSAIVHHGDAGTMFGALAHGVPQVILPQGADNFEYAAMCVAADVAVSLLPDGVDGEALVEAVRRVLVDAGGADRRQFKVIDPENPWYRRSAFRQSSRQTAPP